MKKAACRRHREAQRLRRSGRASRARSAAWRWRRNV